MNYFLRLSAKDNVLIALKAVPKGTKTDGITLKSSISLAHKVAATDIKKGDDVLKYGVVIGRASEDIPAGAHVHVHNLESKYTATHYRKEEVK